MGIDSPRTFAYKMYEQKKAREWLAARNPNLKRRFTTQNTTLAVDDYNLERYNESYTDEMETFMANGAVKLTVDRSDFCYDESYPPAIPKHADNSAVKPFLPGFLSGGGQGYVETANSPYQPDKSAGVDSLGMLSGAIGMTGLPVYNVWNENIGEKADSYTDMNGASPGVDGAGYPVFYAGANNTILKGDYRMTRPDLEKSTVLVPDISLIQKGDLLVRYDTRETGAREDIHIGIVVGLGWGATAPDFGQNPDDLMDQVYVVSVRRGFQCVTIGTWGNPAGGFGGFTDSPKSYQIRRLLKLKDGGNVNAAYQDVSWECVKKTVVRKYTDFPMPENYPISWDRVNVFYPSNEEDGIPKDAYAKYSDPIYLKTDDANNYKTADWQFRRIIAGMFSFIMEGDKAVPVQKNLGFFEHLPPTSFEENELGSLFGRIENGQLIEEKMPLITQTGFRQIGYNGHDLIDYHIAIDIGEAGVISYNKPIYAPEDGFIYYYSLTDYSELQVSDTGDKYKKYLKQCNYSQNDSGFIGMFVTNPSDPYNSRVYLFTHMGAPSSKSREEALNEFKNMFTSTYQGVQFPEKLVEAMFVRKGMVVGWIGNRGYTGGVAHSHVEVYEYFPKDPACPEQGSPTHDGRYLEYGRWKRIDPLSLWKDKQYISPWDHVQDIRERIIRLIDKESVIKNNLGTSTDNLIQKIFRKWNRF